MLAIAERINGMFSNVKKAIIKRDPVPIQDLARRQAEAGASFIDLNVGTAVADQVEAMRWLVEVTQEATKTPLSIDSQKLEVVKAGLEAAKTPALINSCKGQPEDLEIYVPLALKYNASLICLTMDKRGIPQDIDGRVEIAANIVSAAVEHGLEPSRLFIDPVLFPINVDQKQPGYMLEVFRQIRYISDPPPHINVGLSNLSQGTKERSLVNRTFLTMAIAAGLDSAVMDVLDKDLMYAAICAEMLMNKQIYSDSFLKVVRS
ncbi:MAG: dihydropteroate synthase [Candidatus Brocadiales bacterium]|nr:dihydropteroate synthase [Candidatus Brocadiales bacterium]